jgi:MATE family multidrug resistance protein
VTEPALSLFGQDPKLSHEAARFVAVQAPSAVFFLVFSVNRQYLAGRGMGRPVVAVVLLGNIVNAVLCWALVFGKLGLPAMGLLGAGISQGLARAFLGAVLWGVTFGFRLHEDAWVPWSRAAVDKQALAQIAALGIPLGVQFGLEAWAFQIAGLLAGRLGTEPLAANTIVLNLAATSFMVPLGLSMGAAIRVGHLIGAGDPLSARKSSIVSFALGAGFMSVSAVTFFVFRAELPLLYGATPPVASLAARVFPIAAAFQLFDGTQVVGGAVLRGMGRTRPAAVLNLAGYYALALPLGYTLAFPLGGGLRGLWAGLAIGLFFVAVSVLPLTVRRAAFQDLRPVGG